MFRTRLIVTPLLVIALAGAGRAQTPVRTPAEILARIAVLEQELAILRSQLPPPVVTVPHPSTLAGAAAEAATIAHEWPLSTITIRGTGTPDPSAPPAPAIVSAEADRKAEYRAMATKDEAYWKERMRTLQGHLTADEIARDAAATRLADDERATERSRVDINGIPRVDRLLQSKTLDAREELSRLTATVVTDRSAIAACEEEARRAGVPPGWLRP